MPNITNEIAYLICIDVSRSSTVRMNRCACHLQQSRTTGVCSESSERAARSDALSRVIQEGYLKKPEEVDRTRLMQQEYSEAP